MKYDAEYPTVNWLHNIKDQLSETLRRKDSGWAYEKERRLIKPHQTHTYHPFLQEALTGVLGCRADDQLEATVRGLLDQRMKRGHSAVRMYRAQMQPSEYARCASCWCNIAAAAQAQWDHASR
jgi:hypothetical protein